MLWPRPLMQEVKIGNTRSLDIMLKMPHANIRINQVYAQDRKCPNIFEYSKLFLQLQKWYKLLDALDLFKSTLPLPRVHSYHIKNDSLLEHSSPSPLVYLLSHSLMVQLPVPVSKPLLHQLLITATSRWVCSRVCIAYRLYEARY